jgi:hypothetical protein
VARIHGRNGRVYMALAPFGTAEPLNFQAKWSISFATDKAEVTALGDSNKVYVAGLPDASGDFSGFYDDGTVQTYTAATDGVARKFYLYPSTATPANTGSARSCPTSRSTATWAGPSRCRVVERRQRHRQGRLIGRRRPAAVLPHRR